MLPTQQTGLFDRLLDDKVTIFADRTCWQTRCIDVIPECIKRAHEAFGSSLPHVSFYFFSEHADFRSYHQKLFGSKPRHSWQSGTGAYINGQGVVLISDKNKSHPKEAELGIVMHEYSHALFRARYENNQHNRIPTWLDEGCADYLARPWYQEVFKDTREAIKNEGSAGRLPSYQSFARSVYPKARAGYAIARLMVVELMRQQQLAVIAYIFDEAKTRNGAFSDIINEICGLRPRQLYEKVLADCDVDKPGVQNGQSSRQRKSYWISWESRTEIPSTFHECQIDLYFWKLQNYGRKYDQHELNSHKYPNWHAFAIAYLHFLKNTNHATMKKCERDALRAMPRLDRSAKLLTYISTKEVLPAFWQPLPIETTDYLSKCIENVTDLAVRENLRKEILDFLQRFPPIVDTTPMEAFTNEFLAFASCSLDTSGGNPVAAKYDRWPRLAMAFVRVLKDKPASKWSKTLQLYMQSLVVRDEHRYLPSYISADELESLFECDLPDALRQYLGGGGPGVVSKRIRR